MPGIDLGVLDTAIAMVVVILLLSMIVQSLQTFAKKLSKFKSRQIAASLEKLFEQCKDTAPPNNAADAQRVLDHFQQLGRATTFGRHAVESISKADLSKIVTSIEGSSLVPEKAKTSIVSFFTSLQQVQQAMEALAAVQLAPASVARLTDLRTKTAPIMAHVTQLFDGQGNLNAKVIVKDVVSLSDFRASDVLKIVTELQSQIEQAAAAEPNNAALQNAAKAARDLARSVADVDTRLAQVIAQLRERVDALETWYDTVMQGFEERYARHMKTWAFIISLLVTIMLNADASKLWKRLATDDVSKQRILAQADSIQKYYFQQIDAARSSGNEKTVQDLTKKLDAQLDSASQTYPALGLEPFNYADFTWKSIIGWLVMAFLLSLGAPFWQDALESLFGLKNWLRQAGQIQKVEQKSGEGMTKT